MSHKAILTKKNEDHGTEFLTPVETARRLKICRRTLENHTNSGLFERHKIGAASRYCWPDVIEAIKNQKGEQA